MLWVLSAIRRDENFKKDFSVLVFWIFRQFCHLQQIVRNTPAITLFSNDFIWTHLLSSRGKPYKSRDVKIIFENKRQNILYSCLLHVTLKLFFLVILLYPQEVNGKFQVTDNYIRENYFWASENVLGIIVRNYWSRTLKAYLGSHYSPNILQERCLRGMQMFGSKGHIETQKPFGRIVCVSSAPFYKDLCAPTSQSPSHSILSPLSLPPSSPCLCPLPLPSSLSTPHHIIFLHHFLFELSIVPI